MLEQVSCSACHRDLCSVPPMFTEQAQVPRTAQGLGTAPCTGEMQRLIMELTNFMGCVSLPKDVLKISVETEFGAVRPILDS